MGSFETYIIVGGVIGTVIGLAVEFYAGLSYFKGKAVTVLFGGLGIFLGLLLAQFIGVGR